MKDYFFIQIKFCAQLIIFKMILILFLIFTFCKSQVIEINDDNFDKIVENDKVYFILFYTNWCGHCKRVKPTFYDFQADNVHVAAVDW